MRWTPPAGKGETLETAPLAPKAAVRPGGVREWGEWEGGAVGAEGGGAAERDQVAGQLARLGSSPVQGAAEPARGVDRSEHANVLARGEELLGECLDVPVDAALVAP